MKQFKLKGSHVCYDEFNLHEKPQLQNYLQSEDLRNLIENLKMEVIAVLGGDGTMLRAIRRNYKKELPFLGINFGHLGFLLNSKDFVSSEKEYIERQYPMLEATIDSFQGEKKAVLFNEIDIRAGGGKLISLEASIGNRLSYTLDGDGVVVSTPAGTTGYNASLNGLIIPHTTPSFVMTPKALIKTALQVPPIIFKDSEIMTIRNRGRKPATEIYGDGMTLAKTGRGKDVEVTLQKYSKSVTLLIAEDYLETWDDKGLIAQGGEAQQLLTK